MCVLTYTHIFKQQRADNTPIAHLNLNLLSQSLLQSPTISNSLLASPKFQDREGEKQSLAYVSENPMEQTA